MTNCPTNSCRRTFTERNVMKSAARFLLCCLPLWLALRAGAQGDYPPTLLWRISGAGLNADSYLWGTIHLQDRRVFAFTDSLYYFLDQTRAFAMELDPERAGAELLPFMLAQDTSAFVYTVLPDSVFRKLGPVLERALNKPARTVRRKEAWLYAQLRPYRRRRPDDMEQPMDLYLQQLARRGGKPVLGIEDLSDQFNLEEVLSGPFDTQGILDSEESVRAQTEQLTQLYLRQDLAGIERLSYGDSSEFVRKLLRRNRKMAVRMDSIARRQPTFFAIGAGHLPGPEGVLALLRRRGFSVTPVLGGRPIEPRTER
ncbi:TraB/GumN family protein [Flaviaesturariibacter aridisoli]|uniref:TraB/GumN family protein n=2 Tax=Flaviaesturariibacter aridisoli TaxID=2545761 RepID=A0A4R4E736_9BACT|nr:TraB/GumN family protein [Flaviaesturariibacter aridisoli]